MEVGEIKKGEEGIQLILSGIPISKLLDYIGENAEYIDVKKIRNYDTNANYAKEIVEERE